MLKRIIIITLVFATLLFGVPALFGGVLDSFGFFNKKSENFKESFKLKLTETDEIVEISALDYIIGCLFAQIPLSYHEEALKAQAVAAYTYALRLAYDKNTTGTGSFDISDDTVTGQPYFTESKAAEYYGEDYEKYSEKIKNAAEYGINHMIEYNGTPIYAVYHSVSAGVTNTGSAVWGRNFPYLKSVDSNWDKEYENYLCVNEMPIEKMRTILLEYSKSISMPVDYNLWFTNLTQNSAGYAESIMAGDILVSGGDMWRIFNLRSTNFSVKYTGSVFEFTTAGYGHGAGLSQFGADYMAKCGYSAAEILLHYYTGVNLI